VNAHIPSDRTALRPLVTRLIVLAAVALLAFAPAAVPGIYARRPAQEPTTQDFETTLAPWVPAANHELIGSFALDRAWGDSVLCDNPVSDFGDRFAAVTAYDLPQPGQAYWLVTSAEGYGPVRVTLSFYARATVACGDNCAVVATAGTLAPQAGVQFDQLGIATEKWQRYEYATELWPDGTVYPAFGWGSASAAPAEWGGPTAIPAPSQVGFDCVSLAVEQLPDPGPAPN
jgi:hypothetical protein